METRLLRYFVAVAEELHFGRAAQRLHIAQPPLSQQIMKFEEELGVALFQRDRRSVRLTAAGESLLADAHTILRSLDQARDNLLAAAGGELGRLTMGYIAPALNTPLAAVIRTFRTTWPRVRFELRQMGTRQQLEAVRTGAIDIAVVRLFRHDLNRLDATVFHREAYAVIVPEGHALAYRTTVDMSELAGEAMIFFSRQSHPPLYDEWMRLFAQSGGLPRIVQEVESKSAARALTAAGMGISIVPESLAAESRQGVVFLSLTGQYPPLEIQYVTRQGETAPAVHNLVRIFDQQCTGNTQDPAVQPGP